MSGINFRGENSSCGWTAIGGQTKCPYDLDKNPSGSSSGSAVAVTANLTVLAIGTETNGSIVDPSSTNGIVGMKPTVGLVSRSGLIPLSHTLDSPGPMAGTVGDVALCLGVLVGVDESDDRTKDSEGRYSTDYTQFLKKDGLSGKRLGLDMSLFGINEKVDSLMREEIKYLKSQGAEIIEIDEVLSEEADDLAFEVLLYEFKHNLNGYLQNLNADTPVHNIEELIEFNKKDPIELRYYGQEYLEQSNAKGDLDSQEYQEALTKMQQLSREDGIDRVMREHSLDAIIGQSGGPAEPINLEGGNDYPISGTSPSAYAGHPIITVPMGFVDDMPVGISFYAEAWSEPKLLEIAYAYEQGTLHRRAPKL